MGQTGSLPGVGTPKAPHLRIHTINTNRLTALIPRCVWNGDHVEQGDPRPNSSSARIDQPLTSMA
jgi:hypothetical protein